MHNSLTSAQYDLIMENSADVINYDVTCAQIARKSSLATLVTEKTIIPTLDTTSYKYIKKIDDSFSLLENIMVDMDAMTEFFTKIQHSDDLNDKPLSTPFMPVNDIGRVKPEYLTQLVNDGASMINDIVNGRKDMKALKSYFDSLPFLRTKKQLVVTTGQSYSELKDYFKSQPDPQIIPIDSQAIITVCLPFLRNFPAKKKEMIEEVAATKDAIFRALTQIRTYGDSLIGLKDGGKLSAPIVDNVNYYLYNLNRGVDELMSFLTYMIITKVNMYTFNINALNELYSKTLKYGPEGSNLYHESAFERTVLPTDIDSVVNSIIQGDGSALIDYANREYGFCRYMVNAKANIPDNLSVDFIMDKYKHGDYPYDKIIDCLNVIESSLESLKRGFQDEYASPENVAKNAGFEDPMINRFAALSSGLLDVTRYTDALDRGVAKSEVLFGIMAELRESEEVSREFTKKVTEVYKAFNELLTWVTNNVDGSIKSEAIRKDAVEVVTNLKNDYNDLVGVFCTNMIQRFFILEKNCENLIESPENVVSVDGISELDYVTDVIESELNDLHIIGKLMIESEVEAFRKEKLASIYGIFEEKTLEDGNNKESSTPEVKTNTAEVNNADVVQNKAAAETIKKDEGEETSKPSKSFKEVMKELVNSMSELKEKILKKFHDFTVKRLGVDTEFLQKYKESLLTRSYNGKQLNMIPYNQISSDTVHNDINQLIANIGKISQSNIDSFKDENTLVSQLFGFIKPPKGELDTYIRGYYKVGAKYAMNIQKVPYKNTELKNLVTEMIEFCEKYYGGEYQTIQNEINNLTKQLSSKLNSLTNLSSDGVQATRSIKHEVEVFYASVLTGYQHKATNFMQALKKLTPDYQETKPVEEQREDEAKKEEQNQKS